MRTEIDLHVMQEMGAFTRANGLTIEPLSSQMLALLEALRTIKPNG